MISAKTFTLLLLLVALVSALVQVATAAEDRRLMDVDVAACSFEAKGTRDCETCCKESGFNGYDASYGPVYDCMCLRFSGPDAGKMLTMDTY